MSMELLLFFMYMLMLLMMSYNYIICNMFMIYSILIIMKLNYLKWWMMNFMFSLNYYSYALLILSLWILSFIMMNMKNLKKFYLMILTLMFFIMTFNFLSMNLLIYYYLFETSLLMIFYLILKLGDKLLFKVLAGYLLMFYTLLFSFPMFSIIIFIKMTYKTLSFIQLETMNIYLPNFMMIYLLMGFLVKIPMFLFHSWLLKAHVEAPYFGSMILAAIMLKLGSYGLLRMMMIFYKLLKMNYIFIILNMMGSIIMSLMCLRQIDMKILIAMSSIVHMSLMISSMMTLTKISFIGSYLMMLSHGLTSSGLFYLVNMIYMETKSRIMILNKGTILFMPSMTLMWFLLCSSNMAAPLSLNLISEIFMLTSLMMWTKFLIFLLMLYCMSSFTYSIYLFSLIQHGKFESMNYFFSNKKLMMYMTTLLHWIPLNFIILNLNMII